MHHQIKIKIDMAIRKLPSLLLALALGLVLVAAIGRVNGRRMSIADASWPSDEEDDEEEDDDGFDFLSTNVRHPITFDHHPPSLAGGYL